MKRLGAKERSRVPDYWLKKYGAPIDCEDLRLIASLGIAEGYNLEQAGLAMYGGLRNLLAKQMRERTDLIKTPVPGSSTSFWDLTRRERRATGQPGARLISLARVVAKELRDYDRHTSKLMRNLNDATQGQAERLPIKSRKENYALGRAAYVLSEWIRSRHTAPNGSIDGRTSWPDVVLCLEWYGWDLGGAKAPNRAVERAARRWQRRHLPPPR